MGKFPMAVENLSSGTLGFGYLRSKKPTDCRLFDIDPCIVV